MAIMRYQQQSFHGGIISPLLYTRIAQDKYRNSCIELHNMLLYPQGGAYRRSGFKFLGTIEYPCRLLPFVYNSYQAYVLEFSDYAVRIWNNGEIVRDTQGEIICIDSPYSYEMVDSLQYVQTANALYITSPYIRPYVLERSNHNTWGFTEVLFGASHNAPIDIRASGGEKSTQKTKIVIRALDEQGRESKDSHVLEIDRVATEANPITYSWNYEGTAQKFHIYRQTSEDTHFILRSISYERSYKDYGLSLDPVATLPKVRGPYNGEGSYPTTVAIWQQRLIFAGSLCEPQTIWFSKIGDFTSFIHSAEMPDDDPMTITISSAIAEPIQWIYVHRELLFVGTALGEWSVGAYNGILGPRTIVVKKHTSYGTSAMSPLHAGDAMVFIQRDKKVLRQLQYVLEYDSFIGRDLTVFAEHILQGTAIRTLVWQQYPSPILWILLENGTLAGVTYIQEYNIFAWHTHSTQGYIENIVGIPTYESTDIYIVVRRKKGNQSIRYLEKLYHGNLFESKESWRFVDSFIEYRGEAIDRVTGLEHLEGEKVYILADGRVEQEQDVIDGCIQLTTKAQNICVGLPYTSQLIPSISLLPQMREEEVYTLHSLTITTIHNSPCYIYNGNTSLCYPSSFAFSEDTNDIYMYTITMPPQKSKKYNIILQQYQPVQMSIAALSVEGSGRR